MDTLEAQLRDAQITAAKERSLSEVHLRRKRVLEAENVKLRSDDKNAHGVKCVALLARAEKSEAILSHAGTYHEHCSWRGSPCPLSEWHRAALAGRKP